MDIEDSIGRLPTEFDEAISADEKENGKRFFNVRIMRRNKMRESEEGEEMTTDGGGGGQRDECRADRSILPWDCTVFLRTWGCSHNNSDSEYMAGLLVQAGYRMTADKALADIWVLNSCTVKTPSETQLANQIQEALSNSKRVVVSGCVSQASPNEPWLNGVSVIGVQQIHRVVYVVEETLKGNVVRLLSRRKAATANTPQIDLSMPKIRRNEFIEILAINNGCLNHCTYCKTKAARGDLRSFSLSSLVAQAHKALSVDGCRELWLTSEDLGAWGRDIGHTIVDLLRALVQVIPDGCMMRLGMTNPPYILDHLSEIAEILCHPRVYSFLHIPVQSGSDAVLGDMKREYGVAHFCQIMDYMLKNVPNVYIATDFICAFPTETDADFAESVQLVSKYQFPSVFINQFYPRPGTPAARLKKINTIEARRRTAEMTRCFHAYRRYTDERIGEEHFVLICERASDGRHLVGHNKCYEHILVPDPCLAPGNECVSISKKSLLGHWAHVRIVSVSKFYMKSEIVSFPDFEEDHKQRMEEERIWTNGEERRNSKDKHWTKILRNAIAMMALIIALKFILNHLFFVDRLSEL
ncbi:hypothetical protein niasHT_035168 [Heterodera trifolii]|uniref:tRNA-t(6)A37 methylthiotransferase n=1 Tax=Heterodera trifolii TaxID=157864 RepID=A0ABD2IZ16_9BILA